MTIVVVTKDGTMPSGLEHIPHSLVVIETSKPLAMARRRAIQKVKTEWFVFVDDDVNIDPTWWGIMSPYMKRPKMGAIQGELKVVGLGYKWDHKINSTKTGQFRYKTGPKATGQTHNTLIRTELVRDWVPSRPDLECWEDFEITQHILGKGYDWLQIPVEATHVWSWKKMRKNSWWSNKWWKRIKKRSLGEKLHRLFSWVRMSWWHLRNRGWRVFFYYAYFRFWCAMGLIFA